MSCAFSRHSVLPNPAGDWRSWEGLPRGVRPPAGTLHILMAVMKTDSIVGREKALCVCLPPGCGDCAARYRVGGLCEAQTPLGRGRPADPVLRSLSPTLSHFIHSPKNQESKRAVRRVLRRYKNPDENIRKKNIINFNSMHSKLYRAEEKYQWTWKYIYRNYQNLKTKIEKSNIKIDTISEIWDITSLYNICVIRASEEGRRE